MPFLTYAIAEADGNQLEMIRAQAGALKGAPADQVVRVSSFGAQVHSSMRELT